MKLPTTFKAIRVEPEMAKAMQKLKDDTGISDSEQIRRGLVLFLKQQKVYKAEKGGKR